MKIQIINCKNNKWWYTDQINKIYQVKKEENYYETIEDVYGYWSKVPLRKGIIDLEDAIEINYNELKNKQYKTINLRRDYESE